MRSGGCALQQTLTAEAASVLKHSLVLARRRGHAQVTPLHVATTLLSLRVSSFRRACLKSQPHQTSHPLQCRALELCFNVALNRLPTTPGPLIHSQPSLSNALIAALKRAQAHQRRGCIEQQQQQPLLTVKVELEQLIISILDDPSVSRVMREAGFSSTVVKTNIEDSSPPNSVFRCYNSSGGVFSSPCSPSTSESHRETNNNTSNNFRQNHFLAAHTSSEFNPLLFSPPKKAPVHPITGAASSDKDDIRLVLDILLRKKKKNTVIVGDSVSSTEGLVGELMGRLERSEVPDELKSTHFIKFQFTPLSLRYMKRDEVEMKLLELKRKVDSIASGGGGGIFYIGDLKWTVEAASSSEKEEGSPDGEVSGYNPVDHLVSEIGKLFCDCGTSKAKVWLMATASYQTYMRCQMRQPPLEMQWALQAVPVPSGGLGLSLHASSVLDSKMTISQNPSHVLETKLLGNKEQEDNKLNCCEECATNYEKEAQFLIPDQKKMLPFWLQSHSTEDQKKDELTQLKRKWNTLCRCLHQNKQPRNHWNLSNSYNSSSSVSFANNADKPNLVPRFRRQQSCTIEFNFSDKRQATEPVFDSLESMEGKEVKTTLALGYGGSGEKVGNITDTALRRAHVLNILQENVPWQSETVPSIAEALIDSKSSKQSNITWLFLQGNDSIGKRRLALAVAESVFGSAEALLHLDMLKKETTSTAPFSEMLSGALRTHQQLVVLIESVDFADAQFKKFLSDGNETGKFGNLSSTGQVIFILTNGRGITSIEEQNQNSVIKLSWQVSETKPNLGTPPCLGHKRRAELDLFSKSKSPRIEEKEEGLFVSSEQGSRKKDFSRQSSFNTLDLNMKADEEDDDGEDKPGNSCPISSDLTRETIADPLNNSIENRFEFSTSPARDREMAELFLSKIKGSFEEVCGKQCVGNFTVDERVIEDVRLGCGSFGNSLFEKWLKDIFQSSLQTVNFGGKEGILFRLCWGGKEGRKFDSGFMGSSLPKSIQVNYFIE